ncbi:MAG: FAD-binding protein [Bdellovibrionales bacterium]|nr:FAD-binding protein [Bdellovibrionales bacterium]
MTKQIQNWSGAVRFEPAAYEVPETESALRAMVAEVNRGGGRIRVIGSGHSFSPLIRTEDRLVSLDGLQGIVETRDDGQITAWAGTKLWKLNDLLHGLGRGLENLGDIDRQSIAGTVSTGTHGTGKAFGSVSTQLTGLRLVTADGEARDLTAADGDLFRAAQVSLGALGILTQVRLRTVPAYKLKLVQRKESASACLSDLDRRARENRNFEFFTFPYTDVAQTKEVNVTEENPSSHFGQFLNDLVLENGVFKLLSEASRWIPGATPIVAKICGWGVGGATKRDWSHRIFRMPRLVRFQEMEYSVPAERMSDVVRELMAMIERDRVRVHFPIECRFVKGDDIFLSPAHGRDSAYIAVHSYKGMPHADYFRRAEAIFRNHGGRPHWGKMHTLTGKELGALYPKWEAFKEIRAKLDPKGVFLNDQLRSFFA